MNNKEENKKETQKVEEAFYQYIGFHHAKNIAQDLDNMNSGMNEVMYPKELDDWFYDYLNQSKKEEARRNRFVKIKSISSKVAIFFLVITISFAALMFSVDAIRIKVLNFIVEVEEKYTSVQIDEKNENLEFAPDTEIPAEWTDYYLPTYIPNLFQLSKVESFGETKIIFYMDNNNREIQFSWSPNSSSFQIDTEGADSENISINGAEAMLVTKEGLTTVLWFDQENTYFILGKVDEKELIKMAESIQKK